MLGRFKEKKRNTLRARPFPKHWHEYLLAKVPLYGRLPENDRLELQGHVNVFLAEKSFEGCAGFDVTDEVMLTIAAQACLLLLHRDTDYFPDLLSILVYPAEYVAAVTEHDDDGLVHEYDEDRSGETWTEGSMILSWEDVTSSGDDSVATYNVVLHEFAHQLDLENGEMDGVPSLDSREKHDAWIHVMQEATATLSELAETEGERTVIDEYGTEDPSEFFAVATEGFFEAPRDLKRLYPELYSQLKRYYQQDPAAW